jgi:hypothetical protein
MLKYFPRTATQCTSAVFSSRHKSTLAVPGKMSVLSGSNCNLARPYLTKVNIACPKPTGGSLDLAQLRAILPLPLAQTLVAWLLTSKVTEI